MDLLHLILLGLVQGLTEFLPISSSAHLILLPKIFAWKDQGLAYDVAAHLGSLFAVILYFNKDLKRMTIAWIESLAGKPGNTDSVLMWYLIIATLPIAIFAYIFYNFVSTWLRDPLIIAITTIIFGLLLWWADASGKRLRNLGHVTLKDALWIGLAQVLSLVPGTSRSGITMTAGLMLGLDRTSAARFSFLLAVPTIILAGGYETYRLFMLDTGTDPAAFFIVFAVSAASAWLAIKLFLGLLERTGMLPYVIYRLLLGTILIYLFI
ncbi:MAG: undecaprenyl-diphosphate phosphatase [Gammaproteobacteria bacterium]